MKKREGFRKNIVKDKAINKENTEDDIANETEEEQ